MKRRTLLGMGIASAAGTAISCGRSSPGDSWRLLTAAEARTLEAVCAQLIPSDQDAGAREAGVVTYIDNQLSGRFKRHRAAYRQGLAGIDEASRARFAKSFAELDSAGQVEILKVTEEKARAFVDLLLNHTRQGFYGDPRHGGNRERASWKMLGVASPPVRGRA